MMRVLCSVFLLAFGVAVHAAPVTIDGDDFSGTDWSNPENTLIGEFRFEVFSFESAGSSLVARWLAGYGNPDTLLSYSAIDLSRADSEAFSVHAIDYFVLGGMTQGIEVWNADGTSFFWSGSSISDLDNIQRISLFAAGADTIAVLNSVTVGAVVPIPAAVWLFGSALFGLGWFRRVC